jgi:hypothetical protein
MALMKVPTFRHLQPVRPCRPGHLPTLLFHFAKNGFGPYYYRISVSEAELNRTTLARRRSNETNMAHLSYDKIEEYAGIERSRIRKGISFLASIGLVHVEHIPSRRNDRGTANAYRLPFLDPYNHLGTRGRNPDAAAAE